MAPRTLSATRASPPLGGFIATAHLRSRARAGRSLCHVRPFFAGHARRKIALRILFESHGKLSNETARKSETSGGGRIHFTLAIGSADPGAPAVFSAARLHLGSASYLVEERSADPFLHSALPAVAPDQSRWFEICRVVKFAYGSER